MPLNLFVQALIVAATLVINYVLRPKPEPPPKTKFDELRVPNSEEGKAIPVLFGTKEIRSPSVVFYGNLELVPNKVKGGKK